MTDHTLERPAPRAKPARLTPPAKAGLRAFITRLHFYVGLFVGPFILVAAVTGLLYVVTPQLEDYIYRDQLRTDTTGQAQSLAEQAAAAREFVGEGPTLFAVRPAIGSGHTTRVMYTEPGHGPSESRGIFVDPVTLEIRGDLMVYGTSGTLPLRTFIDYMHRDLLLGPLGRNYSELAASWLLIAVLGGVMLWWWRRGTAPSAASQNVNLRTRRFHGQMGIWIAIGLLFIGTTGLTWSQWAGGRIGEFRSAVGWVTPSVSTVLGEHEAMGAGEHDHHAAVVIETIEGVDHGQHLDRVHEVVRAAGIDSAMIEMQVPRAADRGWMIREYDRSWPTQVDTVSVDPRTMQVIDQTDFETFPLIAKLIRWGIDLHMGILFGIANQVLMAGLALALIVTIVYGYRIWWLRRPAPGSAPQTLVRSWTHLTLPYRIGTIVVAAIIGWAMPMIGVSLLAFLAIDVARWRVAELRRT